MGLKRLEELTPEERATTKPALPMEKTGPFYSLPGVGGPVSPLPDLKSLLPTIDPEAWKRLFTHPGESLAAGAVSALEATPLGLLAEPLAAGADTLSTAGREARNLLHGGSLKDSLVRFSESGPRGARQMHEAIDRLLRENAAAADLGTMAAAVLPEAVQRVSNRVVANGRIARGNALMDAEQARTRAEIPQRADELQPPPETNPGSALASYMKAQSAKENAARVQRLMGEELSGPKTGADRPSAKAKEKPPLPPPPPPVPDEPPQAAAGSGYSDTYPSPPRNYARTELVKDIDQKADRLAAALPKTKVVPSPLEKLSDNGFPLTRPPDDYAQVLKNTKRIEQASTPPAHERYSALLRKLLGF